MVFNEIIEVREQNQVQFESYNRSHYPTEEQC